MTRKALRLIGIGVVSLLLFAQLAIAAYVCPGLATERIISAPIASSTFGDDGASDRLAASDVYEAANCDDMGGAPALQSVNLCTEHCRYGQSGDQTPTVAVPAALLNERYSIPWPSSTAAAPSSAAAVTSAFFAAWPPHAILHCCFRI